MDAAYCGLALVTPERKDLLAGIERADSVGIDAHKGFFQPYETGALVVKYAEHLEAAFAIGNDVPAGHPCGVRTTRTSRIGGCS